MKKKKEEKYFAKEWKDMKAGLKSFLKEGQQEDLHRFRVQVKKLRAFLILADSKKQCPKLLKHFKPVRKVFKQAGEIRNIYMNLGLSREHKLSNDAFMLRQHQLMEKATEEFKLKGDKYFEKIKGAHKTLKGEIKPISDIHINLFYKNRLQQIADILTEPKFDDKLHECRKLIKILIYNNKLVHTIGLNEDYLEQVQTTIGYWHDNVLATALFSDNEAKDKTAVANLKKQHIKIKKNITTLAKDFYNKAITVVEAPVEQLTDVTR